MKTKIIPYNFSSNCRTQFAYMLIQKQIQVPYNSMFQLNSLVGYLYSRPVRRYRNIEKKKSQNPTGI